MALIMIAGCSHAGLDKPLVVVLLSDDVRAPKVEGLRTGLQGLGYAPDAIVVDVLSAKGDRSTLAKLAGEARTRHPAVLVAGGGVEAIALKEAAAGQTPVVMMGVASTVRTGLVDSLLHPGGNITGLDNQHAELSAKRLELLTKLLPGVRRVLLLYDPQIIPGQHALEVTMEAARRLRLDVQPLQVWTLEQTMNELSAFQPGEYDAALLLPGYVLESGARNIAVQFDRLKLPVMGPLDLEGEGGLLAAYGVSMRDQGAQAARFVVKMLQGVRPADIPVETPDDPVLVVDLRMARKLGVNLSPVGMALAKTVLTEAGDRP
jgi:putative ABC transport system substrate-binding protein